MIIDKNTQSEARTESTSAPPPRTGTARASPSTSYILPTDQLPMHRHLLPPSRRRARRRTFVRERVAAALLLRAHLAQAQPAPEARRRVPADLPPHLDVAGTGLALGAEAREELLRRFGVAVEGHVAELPVYHGPLFGEDALGL